MNDKKAQNPVTTFSPETEANSRINALQAQISLLEKEIKTFQGRLANRDPKLVQTLKKENDELKNRISLMVKALYGLVLEVPQPKQAEDTRSQYEVLRQAAVEFCKKANIDQELWKSIVS